jgi:four helix bundle protein
MWNLDNGNNLLPKDICMDYRLETLDVYQLAEELSDEIWNLVIKWKYFEKDTVGKQMVEAADSISANIAEGYGRFYYAESKRFYFYARGSIQETKSWLSKSKSRNLIETAQVEGLLKKAEIILIKLNAYIRFVSKSANHIKKSKKNEIPN